MTKEDDLIDKTGLKLRQRIIIITQDDVIHIAMESEDDVKMWLDVLKRLLKAKYSREELRKKEDAKKARAPVFSLFLPFLLLEVPSILRLQFLIDCLFSNMRLCG